eukprot:symbB.v1.2.000322.t1/scaffold6.1/size569917/25
MGTTTLSFPQPGQGPSLAGLSFQNLQLSHLLQCLEVSRFSFGLSGATSPLKAEGTISSLARCQPVTNLQLFPR